MTEDERAAEILADWRARRDAGEALDAGDLIRANPDLADRLRAEFATMRLLNLLAAEDAIEKVASPADTLEVGTSVGGYNLERVLGRGGTATVYLASQETPLRRDVALKLGHVPLLDGRTAARFDIERESLSLLEHPYTARVLDAGVHDDGRPFVVMEYVDGLDAVHWIHQEK